MSLSRRAPLNPSQLRFLLFSHSYVYTNILASNDPLWDQIKQKDSEETAKFWEKKLKNPGRHKSLGLSQVSQGESFEGLRMWSRHCHKLTTVIAVLKNSTLIIEYLIYFYVVIADTMIRQNEPEKVVFNKNLISFLSN